MLNNLPKDLILKVFSLLGLRDIARVALVSKSLLEMAQEKMPIRDDLKEFVTQNKSLTDAQVNYLLSDNTYSKLINGQFKSIELAMARHDKFVQQESARVSALRYPASGSQIEEQAQQQLALQKGYLPEELAGLTDIKKEAVLRGHLSPAQAKSLRDDQVKLIVAGYSYNDVKSLKAYQTGFIIDQGWSLEKAKVLTVMQARMENMKRKDICFDGENTVPEPKAIKII